MSLQIPDPPVLDQESVRRIQELKKEKDVVILAHNYQRPEVQDAADFVGDSFVLAKISRELDSENIIFCGVRFMAESAKILAPNKRVVHPEPDSSCTLAAMIDLETLAEWKAKYPRAKVAAYINTTAELKTQVDICITSSNAVKAISTLESKQVLLVPDENLGHFVQKRMPDREIILFPGYCRSHKNILLEDLRKLKAEHPQAVVLAHPECLPGVQAEVDHLLGTAGMINFVLNSEHEEFIIGTERELIYRIKKELMKAAGDEVAADRLGHRPDKAGITGKKLYGFKKALCPDMKKITLEKLLRSLETLEPELRLPPDIMEAAKRPLDRMVAAGTEQ